MIKIYINYSKSICSHALGTIALRSQKLIFKTCGLVLAQKMGRVIPPTMWQSRLGDLG